jgi:myo-inositol 2-dehydrogenase/D-chiro-inositol 1-dehydrogenase
MCGAGDFGSFFARFVREAGELVAVCDANPEALSRFRFATAFDGAEFTDFRRMLEQPAIDAVLIATPNFTHAAIAVAAAESGRHVFCEKPMAISVPECWEMVDACDRAGVKLMVGHKRRLRPPWAKMIELRESLGEVIAITACLYFDARPYDWGGWWTRADQCGGTLFLSGVHTADWMRAMCGDVTSVRAVAGPRVDPRYEFSDTLHVTLEFDSGAVASLNVSFVYPLALFREAVGPTVICRNGGMKLYTSLDHIELTWQSSDSALPQTERFADLGFDVAYRKELTDFTRWITEGREPCLTWREGLRCVEVLEAAKRSVAEGGAVIQLPLYPELEAGRPGTDVRG